MKNISEINIIELQEFTNKLKLENEKLKNEKQYGLVWEVKETDKEDLHLTNLLI